VIDLTAGLLGDTLLFLSFGCEVTAIERNPIIAFLIASALSNAEHPCLKKLKFESMDAQTFLKKLKDPEVIYYDPMFEDANEKASPRKEMRIFRSLIGSDSDGVEVFKQALDLNPKRLVIKRPKHSSAIMLKAPLVFSGKATRYDVYLGKILALSNEIP
jgi:16S rRNA (guanine1516-N2)-methyltransferase